MTHHGEILEKAVRNSGIPVSTVATLLKKDRKTLYYWFEQKILEVEKLKMVGKAIKHDFSKDLPDLFKDEDKTADEAISREFREKHKALQDKYYALQEKYLALVESSKIMDEITRRLKASKKKAPAKKRPRKGN